VVNKYTIGETYQRIQAGSHNSVAIWFGAIDLTSSVIALVLIFLLMSYINIYILIIYIFIPVITILYSAASYKIKAKLNQSLQSEESAQMNRLHELVANLSLIKSFGASNWAAERYKNARSRAYLSKKRIIYADTILSILQDAVDFVLLSSFAFIIRIPATTWGTIGVAFLWYDNVKRKSTEFYASFVNLPNSVVPFKRLVEVTEYMQLDTAAFNRDMRDISLEHISLRYGEKNALNDVTLNIERGAKVALVGKNGSGKTSIIKIVLGLICQTSGNIALPFATYSERKNETSLTMAEPQLYETSVLENIDMCSDDVTNAQIDKSLSTLYINELRGKQASELSSGERQRVAVARAMTKNSMLMVLDEPTSALDPNTSTRVMKSILDSDATVLFTTHDIAIAKLADRIVWLEDGAIKNTFDRDEFALLNEW
jgi:ATP-binding cassette subfamily B protein